MLGEYIARTLAAFYDARVWRLPAASAREREARRLLREAAGLFFKRGSKVIERCAELEDRAWKLCPYSAGDNHGLCRRRFSSAKKSN